MSAPSAPLPATQSQLGLVSAITGIIGLVFSLMGCMFSPFLMIGAMLCLVGAVTGYTELKAINAGLSQESNRGLATVGALTGGGGCALATLTGVLIALVIAAYFASIVFLVVLGALAGN
jgi:hypothetical protein